MVNTNGLCMEDMKTFLDLMKKANSCQLTAMIEHAKHEIECRNISALNQFRQIKLMED